LLSNHQDIRIPLIMAGAVLSLLPILVLYVFGQKYFVQGIALTGMKG
ncbi:MAG: carbohydrate ABC transporter permease, partial [Gemmatimonadetes bacterium]|nr:carbohydrate ABC transporter permease [Gemmatimonadota bacterium]